MPLPIVVIDTETSGLDPCEDCLLEIGAVSLDTSSRVTSTFYRQINPSAPITPESAAVHGLSAEGLAAAPSLKEVVLDLSEWLPPNALMAGQNVWFDAAFISRAFQRFGIRYPFDYHVMELWSVSAFVLPRTGVTLQKYGLDQLCELFGIPRQTPHNAISDALASAEVYRQLATLCESRLGGSLEET